MTEDEKIGAILKSMCANNHRLSEENIIVNGLTHPEISPLLKKMKTLGLVDNGGAVYIVSQLGLIVCQGGGWVAYLSKNKTLEAEQINRQEILDEKNKHELINTKRQTISFYPYIIVAFASICLTQFYNYQTNKYQQSNISVSKKIKEDTIYIYSQPPLWADSAKQLKH